MSDEKFHIDLKLTSLEGKKVLLRTQEGFSPRRFISLRYDTIMLPYAVWVWSKNNRGLWIEKGEQIHHVDFDCLNDDISTLIKLTNEEHKIIHERKRNEALFSIGSRIVSSGGSVVRRIQDNPRPDWFSVIYSGQTRESVNIPGPEWIGNRNSYLRGTTPGKGPQPNAGTPATQPLR